MSWSALPAALKAQAEACSDALRQAQAAAGGANVYAVLDLAAVSEVSYWHRLVTTQRGAVNLFKGQAEESAWEQAPWLIALNGTDVAEQTWRRTVDEALASEAVCWLVSTLDMERLARRLSRRMTALLPEGEVLLRYYDARLFETLWRGLPSMDREAFGAFGDSWWYLDQAMALQSIALAGAPADDPFEPPWRPTPAQAQALVDISETHQLSRLLAKRRPDEFLSLLRERRWAFVVDHTAAARALGVTDFADCLRYCELALVQGEDFATHADWQPVWSEMTRSGLGLRAACARIRPESS